MPSRPTIEDFEGLGEFVIAVDTYMDEQEAKNKQMLGMLIESAKLLSDAPRGLRSDAWKARQKTCRAN